MVLIQLDEDAFDKMKDKGQQSHDRYLEQLINNFEVVGEDRWHIRWIIQNGIWMADLSTKRFKLCDIIAVYYDNHVSCVELKGSQRKRSVAIEQLESSERFVRSCLGYRDIIKKVAYYNGKGGYDYEVV